MPLPKPKQDEGRDEFVARCMSDTSMLDDFPDNDQRLAVCFGQWDDKGIGHMDYKYCDFEVKEVDAETGEVSGYGSTFGNEDHGGDVVQQGAFADSISKGLPAMLWSHDFTMPPVGVWTEAKENKRGLFLKGRLFRGEPLVDRIYKGLVEKAITGLSIGFVPVIQKFDNDREVRVLEKVDLKEVSFVLFPMNDRARVQAVKARHSLLNGQDVSKRELEAFLRDAGLSREQAKAIAANGHDGLQRAGCDDLDDVKGLSESLERMRLTLS